MATEPGDEVTQRLARGEPGEQQGHGVQPSGPAPHRNCARLELLLQLANHVESQISLGETRASLLLAAGGATAAAYLATTEIVDLWSRLSSAGRALLAAAVATLCIAIILALWAVRPAYTITKLGTSQLRASPQRQSVLTFSSIAAQSSAEYVASFRAKSDSDLELDLLQTIHGKSLKARDKFTELLISILFLIASISFFALSIITLLFDKQLASAMPPA